MPSKKKIHLTRTENNYPSVNELKRRIRDVKRLLNRVDLPADARIVQERALKGYERDLEDENKRRDRSQMIKKYHFVRFLERKAATKDLNRLLRREKELDPKEDKAALKSLKKQIHSARVNLNYTIYYPLTEKYISLYADKKQHKKSEEDETEADTDTVKLTPLAAEEKPPMWNVVEKSMAEGTLDRLRDGKLKTGLSTDDTPTTSSTTDKKSKDSKDTKKSSHEKNIPEKKSKSKSDQTEPRNRRERRREDIEMREAYRKAQNDNDNDSDGGFFEE
ncbi:hypothetical protein ASPWEDRAFT_103173 [Aspergillus wentii DTO 134E9]|uniref:rRNA-processing protein EFG1 n=1 Tax=Aspergillus wentii DTO 134E9 TaxID=1073089 RepID=A0A1L9RVL1_ASPWE|nr:uncharacterized protein ASPWEDRAFT_103173 [Aspergillus wentii DTO 134E9]OJJ38991.1 hypothetical protein ASPWEDRAFT_103173 [Aspergillus wentii DTO 134E9]